MYLVNTANLPYNLDKSEFPLLAAIDLHTLFIAWIAFMGFAFPCAAASLLLLN